MNFYQLINQQWSKHHGQHRQPATPSHDHPAVGAGNGSGGAAPDNLAAAFAALDPAAPAIPYAGIGAGELTGYRLWWLLPSGLLSSIAHRREWLPRKAMHGDVDKRVACDAPWTIWGGVYAFMGPDAIAIEVEDLVRFRYKYERTGWHSLIATDGWCVLKETRTFVWGTVKMWGEVVEHEIGYRAQFAKITRLDGINGPGDIEALRRRYGV